MNVRRVRSSTKPVAPFSRRPASATLRCAAESISRSPESATRGVEPSDSATTEREGHRVHYLARRHKNARIPTPIRERNNPTFAGVGTYENVAFRAPLGTSIDRKTPSNRRIFEGFPSIVALQPGAATSRRTSSPPECPVGNNSSTRSAVSPSIRIALPPMVARDGPLPARRTTPSARFQRRTSVTPARFRSVKPS